MELTSKQRATLKGLASKEETIFQVGKGGVTDAVAVQITKALQKRELVKVRLLETAPVLVAEAAGVLAEKTGASVVQTIGSKVVLFKRNTKNPVIQL